MDRHLTVAMDAASTHTHTHNRFTAVLEFVWDYLGQQVPER